MISCLIYGDEETTSSLPFPCVFCDPDTPYAQKWYKDMRADKWHGIGYRVTKNGNIVSGPLELVKMVASGKPLPWPLGFPSKDKKGEENTKRTNLPVDAALTKCVAKFQNGRQCRYNAKPGRTTCDRAGHKNWENRDTSNSSALEEGEEGETV